jgi:O-antigen ligase
MKALFWIDDNLNNRISYYHVMLMLVTLPFDQFYSHIVLISFALHTLFHLKKEKLKEIFTQRTLMLQAVFFLTLISLSYTLYPAAAAIDITRQLVILLFPLFFSLTSLNISKYRNNLLILFSAFYLIHYFKLPVRAIFSDLFINHKFSAPINMHATFLSLQIAVAFFFILSQLFKAQASKHKIILIISAVLLLAGIIQLGSKAVLVVILAGVNIAVPYFLISTAKRSRYILITATLSVFIIAGALNISSLKDRYVTGLETDLSNPMANESVEPRIVRWQAAIEVAKQKPIIGYGAGSELHILGDKYFNEKLYISYLHRLNAHNQYISFLLTTGLIGLLVYVVTLYSGFRIAFRENDLLFFVFVLLIAVVSLSESLLNAEKGVYFYSLFFSLFVFSNPERVIERNYLFT